MSKITKSEFSYAEFQRQFPNDDACLEAIWQMTYGQMKCCPKCKSTLGYVKVAKRRAYGCRKCYHQLYPTVGTVFERCRIPLVSIMYALFVFSVSSKNGVSALELARTIRVSHKTALRILTKIREYMTNDETPLENSVSIDETFVGGKNINRHYDKKVAQCQGRSYKDKVPVLGMIENGSGRAIAKVLPNVSRKVLHPVLRRYIISGSTIHTDEYRGYQGLEKHYERISCNHKKKQYVSKDGASSNIVETFWSILKRTIKGAYIKVSKHKLSLYVKEVVWRYNNRLCTNLFNLLLADMVPSSPIA